MFEVGGVRDQGSAVGGSIVPLNYIEHGNAQYHHKMPIHPILYLLKGDGGFWSLAGFYPLPSASLIKQPLHAKITHPPPPTRP